MGKEIQTEKKTEETEAKDADEKEKEEQIDDDEKVEEEKPEGEPLTLPVGALLPQVSILIPIALLNKPWMHVSRLFDSVQFRELAAPYHLNAEKIFKFCSTYEVSPLAFVLGLVPAKFRLDYDRAWLEGRGLFRFYVAHFIRYIDQRSRKQRNQIGDRIGSLASIAEFFRASGIGEPYQARALADFFKVIFRFTNNREQVRSYSVHALLILDLASGGYPSHP